MPGSADTPARTSHLRPGDLDTDSDEYHDLTAEELIQREARRLEERGAARVAAQQTSETECQPECPTTSRWRAPSIPGVFGSQTPTRVPSREHRDQPLPSTFVPDTPERPSRSRSARDHPERPDPPPPAPDPPTGTMADPGPARLPPPKVPKLLMFSGEGEALTPDKLKRWLRIVKKYLARSGLNDDSPGVADYYGFYTEGKANNAFQTLDTEEENLTLSQLTHCFTQLFEDSPNTDDTYHKWQNVRQTAGGQPAPITKIAGELADLKGSLPAGSIADYGQKQRFLDAMDSRLCCNVEPQLRPEDTGDQMVAVAERYDATMYRTGGYKGSDRSQASSSKTHKPKKENTYRKPSTTSTPRNTDKGKAPAKNRTYTKSNKPSKAEKDRRKAAGACFYCGKSGHMANECPKNEVKTNHVRLSEESPDSSEGEYEPNTDSTEELDGSGSIRTYKTTVGTPKDRPFQELEFTININGKHGRVLADTETSGGTLISNKFITTHNIPNTARKNPVTLKMAVNGWRSTSNFSVEVIIQLGKMRVDKVPMLVTPISDYDILISMDDLLRLGAVIDCQKNSIYISKYKVRVTCDGKSRES